MRVAIFCDFTEWGVRVPYLSLIVLVVMIAALVDIIGSDAAGIRGLPRWAWLLLVIILPLVGSIVWFLAGRPVSGISGRVSGSGRASALGYPEYDVPGRFEPQDPEADAEFLRRCRERAEQQRRQGELDRRRREREAD
ncbi:phospholipase D-like protein [Williamsia muralis]|uniref:Phospholipase D-like protein n=1 Tax=Williamsia marianensis TaxID=85044 RepID=A0A495KBM7_WILMA|nr:phospholipase D-like protein [Williamsia muralis]